MLPQTAQSSHVNRNPAMTGRVSELAAKMSHANLRFLSWKVLPSRPNSDNENRWYQDVSVSVDRDIPGPGASQDERPLKLALARLDCIANAACSRRMSRLPCCGEIEQQL